MLGTEAETKAVRPSRSTGASTPRWDELTSGARRDQAARSAVLLRGDREIGDDRVGDARQESVRIGWRGRPGYPYDIVTEQGPPVVRVRGSNDGAGRRVRHRLIALGRLDDERPHRHALERDLAQVWRVGDRVAGLGDPLGVVD